MEIVDTWLEEDRLLPRKQRHTGVRIFQRLRDEHQFTGGQRTVLAYVRSERVNWNWNVPKRMNDWNIRRVRLKWTLLPLS